MKRIFKPFYIVKPWPREKSYEIRDLGEKLCEAFGLKYGFRQLLRKYYLRFQLRYDFYYRLLCFKKPSRIYFVVGYFRPELVAAARALNIECVEVQHGNLDKYHIGYSYPGDKEKIAYFPDKFMSWGTFWTDFPEFPLAPQDIMPIGFQHFREKYQKYAHIQRKPRQVVVVSQNSICNALAAMLLKDIDALKDYEIVYKLHPAEYQTYQEVPELLELVKYPNFKLQHGCDLYALFAESQYVVGVYSTALYEAIGLGCSPVIAQVPGWEMMSDLIRRYDIPVATDEKPLHRILESANPCEIDAREIFLGSL